MRLGIMGKALRTSFLASCAVQLANVLTGVLLARALGPHGRGELAAVILWPALLSGIGSMGMSESVTYFAARADGAVERLAGTALAVAAAQSVALVGLGAAIVPLVHARHGGSLVTAYAFLAYIPLYLTSMTLLALLNGLQRFATYQALRFLTVLATATWLLAVSVAGALTIQAAAACYLGANALAVLAAAVLVRRELAGALRIDRALAPRLIWFGLRSHVTNVSSVLNERLDQLVISIFLAPARLGIYVVAVTLTSVTTLVGASVAQVALPAVAGMDDAEARRVGRRLVLLTAAVSAAVTAPLLFVVPDLIRLFFGASFAGAAGVARILLVASVILSTNRALGAVLTGMGRPLDAGIGESVALGVTVISLAVLLPALGLAGAALASLLAYSASTAWMLRRARNALAREPRVELVVVPGVAR